ncbi:CLUMA_CG021306, isoform A [Clunio marinus]|uniref:Hexosyltransferase n=1 Tax=Clunio marinus TaxID=568069 RepID=A0A1J1J7K3_9DIPT|nr:CLUMA_CG021306, isoform A [Clunio marinus]
MLERRSLMSLLIGLTFCVSIWQLMLQQQQKEQFYGNTSHLTVVITLTNNDSTIPTFQSATLSSPLNTSLDLRQQLELLPKNDFNQLIDLENFEFLTKQKMCKNLVQSPTVAIVVHSAPLNFRKRLIIRETWGSDDPRAVLVFMIGVVNSTIVQDEIDNEQRMYGDIVQGNFIDAYRNITYKHVMTLKWFVYFCHEANFLLKTDDDVFVNTPLMYRYLETPSAYHKQFHNEHQLLLCHRVSGAKVKRTYRSKWRVSYDEYLNRHFPNYCPGYAILYSSDVVFDLYRQAQKLPYFWIDDIHITGNVASKLNISITPTNGLFLTKTQQEGLLNGRIQTESYPFFVAQPDLSEKEIRKLWSLVTNVIE